MNILLVEPDYKNKYPPLGLMKISAYHKHKGDRVFFVKGKNVELRGQQWDRIYITTLFTFHWNKTIDTIIYYLGNIEYRHNVYVGGILSTLLYDELIKMDEIQGITILRGLLDRPGILGADDIIVDQITPDYDMIDIPKNEYLDYEYKIKNAYISSTTKGCIRKCKFCAVKTLEPEYCDYIDIKDQIKEINDLYGEKRDLMLMDNNILASKSLENIVNDLIVLGFGRGNKSFLGRHNRYLTRHIDFNQGTDARLLSEEVITLLAKLEVKPLRIAFDYADDENIRIYMSAQRLAANNGFLVLSNYVLFNFEDSPFELYKRLKINVDLNIEFEKQGLKTRIWSFPMKYMPLSGEHSKDRKYVGKHWNKKLLRGIQCVLNATHGVVGPKKEFFDHAFGSDFEEFMMILYMPEKYIIKRKENILNGNINNFKILFHLLNEIQKREFINLIQHNQFDQEVMIRDEKVKTLYMLYKKGCK